MTKDGKKRTYKSWRAMLTRCCDPGDKSFPKYGGSGIAVCERWKSSFQNFVDDMGVRPEGKTLDRVENSKGYEPGNCRWADRYQQNQNRKNCANWGFSADDIRPDGSVILWRAKDWNPDKRS